LVCWNRKRVAEAEDRVAALTARIERLKAEGLSTSLSEQLLGTLQTSVRLMPAHVRKLANQMIAYRCDLMSGERIQAVRIVEAADDAGVTIKAAQLFAEHPEHPTIEIWESKRLVARLARSSFVKPTPGTASAVSAALT
jgi:hypothetical protein